MKRWLLVVAAVIAIALPRPCRAQSTSSSRQSAPYNDVEDSQALRIASYLITPIGMGLEWGIARPLHDLATNSPIAPMLSGDSPGLYFGQTNNASKLPPRTFAPFQMPANPDELVLDNGTVINPDAGTPLPPYHAESSATSRRATSSAPAVASPPATAAPSSGQPVIH